MTQPKFERPDNRDPAAKLAEAIATPWKLGQCQCADTHCPACTRSCAISTCANEAIITLFRLDMEDRGGTPFCAACADDALESGVFSELTPAEREISRMEDQHWGIER